MTALEAAVKKAGHSTVRWGEPTRPPNDHAAYLWYAGEFEKEKTLGNVMVTEIVRLRVHWRRPESGDVREVQEVNLWETCRKIQEHIREDSDLGGNVTDLEIGEAVTGWVEVSGSMRRALTMDIRCVMLEEEAITP